MKPGRHGGGFDQHILVRRRVLFGEIMRSQGLSFAVKTVKHTIYPTKPHICLQDLFVFWNF